MLGHQRRFGEAAVAPQPQAPARFFEGCGDKRAAVAVPAHGGRHDEFCARAFDRVGDVEVRVGGEGRVASPEQQIAGRRIAAVAQVQHRVF